MKKKAYLHNAYTYIKCEFIATRVNIHVGKTT